MKKEIEACIQAVKCGEREAFTLIIKTYQQPLLRYIRYISCGQRDMEDVVQDVFIKVYTRLSQYKPHTNFESWMYKIAYNHTMTVLKKKAKEPIVYMDTIPEVVHLDTYGSQWTREVIETLKQLSPDERAILFLRVYKELSYKEISKIMKKNESLLRKKFERTKEKFIKSYQEVSEHEKRKIR